MGCGAERTPAVRGAHGRGGHGKDAPGPGIRPIDRGPGHRARRPLDREGLVPYSPFVEVLQWVARISPPETLQAQLARLDGSAELGQLVPEITPHVRKGQPAVSTTAEGHR
jgi:hypothetical protein